MEVVVANRRSAGSAFTSPVRQPDKLTEVTKRVTSAVRTSIKLHHVAAFRVAARHAVLRSLGFRDFEHGTAHVALDLEGVRRFGCLGRVERASHFLRPTQGVGVLVLVLEF